MRAVRTALEIVFWIAAALIAWTQLGYALTIGVLARVFAAGGVASARRARGTREAGQDHPPDPSVSLIVAAHDEERVIGAKVENALALRYPRELLEVMVACDGCGDATARHAREAGADLVLELPRGGKILAQDAAVERSSGEIVAFSDANSLWAPDALRELASAFADPQVGYACGQVRFVQGGAPGAHAQGGRQADGADATNQEGVYWRYEMAQRSSESRLSSITAGNGAIYATRPESYMVVDPIMDHDLSFPFNMVKRGWRAVYVPSARATEKMVPSLEGEWRRKRRMMSHTWPIVLRGGMLSPRGYSFGYAAMIFSHRFLRYLTPFLHAIAFLANVAVVSRSTRGIYMVTLVLQVLLGACAGIGGLVRVRPLLIARYYFLTTLSAAAGLWDWLRHGTAASWDAAEGTR